MNKNTTLGKDGFWCPYCGEFIDIDELDCDDNYDIQMHGETYFTCPECGKGFFVKSC